MLDDLQVAGQRIPRVPALRTLTADAFHQLPAHALMSKASARMPCVPQRRPTCLRTTPISPRSKNGSDTPIYQPHLSTTAVTCEQGIVQPLKSLTNGKLTENIRQLFLHLNEN